MRSAGRARLVMSMAYACIKSRGKHTPGSYLNVSQRRGRGLWEKPDSVLHCVYARTKDSLGLEHTGIGPQSQSQ